MADTAKPPRKAPQPRGLTIEIPLDHTDRALQLAAGAGLSTKAQVESALAEFILANYLEPFLMHLGQRAIARTKKLMGSGAEPAIEVLPMRGGLTPDGGIPIVAKE